MTSSEFEKLVNLLDNPDRHARAEAAIQLGQQQYSSALPVLRKLSNDQDDIIAIAAMYACWELGEDNISAKRVISALQSGDEALIQQVVQIVTIIGESLIPKLEPFLGQSPDILIKVLQLLEEIGGPKAFKLIQTVQSSDHRVIQLIDEISENWDDDS